MSEATRSDDHSGTVRDAHLGGSDTSSWDDETGRSSARSVADRIVGIANPRTVLDVGCGRGTLVQALAEKGVEASGVDASEDAVAGAHADVRDRLRVAAATEPIEGRYDLVSCLGVVERLTPVEAQAAIDGITAATDLVLFSSNPGDHDEATHVNTRPTAQWVAWFAERGLFRRTDVDLSFISPWAVLLERGQPTLHTLTQRYEEQFAALNTELVQKRAALLQSHGRITSLNAQLESQVSGKVAQQARLVEQWQAEVIDARHQLLTTRDHIVGTEAEATRLTRDNSQLRREITRARKQLRNVRGRLKEVRERVQRLENRNRQLADGLSAARSRPSFARRAARKVLGR